MTISMFDDLPFEFECPNTECGKVTKKTIGQFDNVDWFRAVAIMETASLEIALEDAILHKLINLNYTEYSELFVGDAPLGNYGVKIKVG